MKRTYFKHASRWAGIEWPSSACSRYPSSLGAGPVIFDRPSSKGPLFGGIEGLMEGIHIDVSDDEKVDV